MNTKKIIIILLVAIIIIGIITIIILNSLPSSQNTISSTAEPTGVVVPTREVPANTLDIVKIDPQEQSINIPLDKKITITFSQNITSSDFVFSISPETPHSTIIENNRLIIEPTLLWQLGTKYSYSINLAEDNQKVRLYTFTTTGPTQEFLPDTQPQGAFEQEMIRQKEQYPDVYVSNHTPYETDTFSVVSEYDPNPPDHDYFIVTSKIEDVEQVRREVNVWLQALDLSEEQINALDIRYNP